MGKVIGIDLGTTRSVSAVIEEGRPRLLTPVGASGGIPSVVAVDDEGRTLFYDMMFNRAPVYFYAFDILCLDGEDLREKPTQERKEILQGVVSESPQRLLYVDHIEEEGEQLFELICKRDMEGIVAKPKESPYRELRGKTPWIKIKNPDYSQAEGRRELFHPSSEAK